MSPASPLPDVLALLNAVAGGDAVAAGQILPLVYEDLRGLAAARMASESAGHTLQPTALVHEAWLRVAGSGDKRWRDRTHFFRVAALAMRHVLVEHARRKSCEKRGGNLTHVRLDDVMLLSTPPEDRVLLVDEALERLEQLDPDAARLVTLKFFGNYTTPEIARILEISERGVERQWTHARARLMRLVREAT